MPVTYDESAAVPNVGIGAVRGAIGGLLVGLGAFIIPGIGPVIGAGWLGSTVGSGLKRGNFGEFHTCGSLSNQMSEEPCMRLRITAPQACC